MTHLWIQKRMSERDRIALLERAFQMFSNTRLNSPSQFNDSSLSHHLDYLLENFQNTFLKAPSNAEMVTDVPQKTFIEQNLVTAAAIGMYLWLSGLVRDLNVFVRERFLHYDSQTLIWQTLYELRYIYRNQGFYDKEEILNRIALSRAWMELPKMHPLALPIVGDLAYSLLRQKRLSESMEWYQWVLWARTIVLGRRHPATTGAVNGVGLVLEAEGKFGEALSRFVDAYRGRERRLGPFDKMTGTVLGNVVKVVVQMKHVDLAYWREKHFEYYWQNPHTSVTRRYSASIDTLRAWTQQKDCDKIMLWTNRTLNLWDDSASGLKVFEDVQDGFVDATDDGAWACQQSGNTDGALSIFGQVLSTLERSCNCTTEDISTVKVKKVGGFFSQIFHRLASIYLSQDEYEDSLLWNLRAFKFEVTFSKSLPPSSPAWTVELYNQISTAQRATGRFRDALEMDARSQILQEYVCIYERWRCKEEWDPKLKYADIAGDLAQLGRVREAIEIWHDLLVLVNLRNGECSDNNIAFLSDLANALCRLGEYDLTRTFFRKAITCRIKILGQENGEVYNLLYALGKTDLWAGDYESGLALLDFVGGKYAGLCARGGVTLNSEWKNLIELLFDRQLYDDARRWTDWLITWGPEQVSDCGAWIQEAQQSWTMSNSTKERFGRMCSEARMTNESIASTPV